MIGHLRGILIEKHPNTIIVEAGGVGYDVAIPVSTFSRLPDVGNEVKLRIHTHVREDAFLLYGFATQEEKILFEKLIIVSGIGAKVALGVLSGIAPADLIQALRSGDVGMLTRIPGIGKKTAERMIVELKDKLDAMAAGMPAGTAGGSTAAAVPLNAIEQDVLSALVNLGSQRPTAEAAIKKAKSELDGADFETLFRRALQLVR